MKRAWHIFLCFIICTTIRVAQNYTDAVKLDKKIITRASKIHAKLHYFCANSIPEKIAKRNLLANIIYARSGYASFFRIEREHTLCVRFDLKPGNDWIERRIGLHQREGVEKHTSYAKFMRLAEFTESHEISQVLFTPQKAVSSNSNYLNDVIWSYVPHVYATVIIQMKCISEHFSQTSFVRRLFDLIPQLFFLEKEKKTWKHE